MADVIDYITFDNDSVKGANSTVVVNGTLDVDYSAMTVTGTVNANDGTTNENFSSFVISMGSNNVYTLSSNGSNDPLNDAFIAQYVGETPSGANLTIALENNEYASKGSKVSSGPECFVSGTLIRTSRGEVAVEHLMVGDLVVTASDATRKICWIGQRTIDCRSHPHALDPVRIAANAFGERRPARDLFLSPGHPVLVGADEENAGGYLVPIMCLINGTTIKRVAMEKVTYWHVELDQHDILLAEGLPAESYIDLGSRLWFGGADGAFHDPDVTLPDQLGRCRPVAIDGPAVEAERRRLDVLFAMQLDAACAWPRDLVAVF